jgi:hypothetical protein
MPDITGTTRAQTLFLRAFHTSPTGPAPADWPSPAILRKWLRKPAFRRALATIQETLQFQSDFQLSRAANAAARRLLADDAELTTHDLGRLLRLAHLRQRFSPAGADPDAPPHANPHHPNHRDNHDDDEGDDDNLSAPGCEACMIRRHNPDWIEDAARFARLAFEQGYASPLREWPDFPDPVPQDTFYYKLVQSPAALLRYMELYDQSGNDHRFQPILMACKHLLFPEHPDLPLPRFQSQRPQPPGNGDGPWRIDNQPATQNH